MRIALLCPGQGSQHVGMGEELAAVSLEAAALLADADTAYGGGLKTLMFAGPEADLTRTTNAQPALLTASMMALAALRARVPALQFAAAAGHSLGEFSALVGVGALALADAVPLVRDRGAFMQEAVPVGEGAMAACIAERGPVEALLAAVIAENPEAVVQIANLNGPGQVVISGSAASVGRARELAADHGIRRCIPLEVSAPFHSVMMIPAKAQFARRIADIPVHPFAAPVVTNLEATANSDPTRVHQLLIEQITAPVRWTDCCQALLDAGCDTFIECGPGTVLSNILRRGWKERELTLLSVCDKAGLDTTCDALKEL